MLLGSHPEEAKWNYGTGITIRHVMCFRKMPVILSESRVEALKAVLVLTAGPFLAQSAHWEAGEWAFKWSWPSYFCPFTGLKVHNCTKSLLTLDLHWLYDTHIDPLATFQEAELIFSQLNGEKSTFHCCTCTRVLIHWSSADIHVVEWFFWI